MDLEGFSNKDKGIITRHPDASPYELLEHGLSQKAYDRLIAQNEKQKVEKLEGNKEQPESTSSEDSQKKSNVLAVSVEPFNPIPTEPKGRSIKKAKALSVLVRDKKSGRSFTMSAYNARLLNKGKFEILS